MTRDEEVRRELQFVRTQDIGDDDPLPRFVRLLAEGKPVAVESGRRGWLDRGAGSTAIQPGQLRSVVEEFEVERLVFAELGSAAT